MSCACDCVQRWRVIMSSVGGGMEEVMGYSGNVMRRFRPRLASHKSEEHENTFTQCTDSTFKSATNFQGKM